VVQIAVISAFPSGSLLLCREGLSPTLARCDEPIF
jgi:hypothetical protein